MKVLMVHNYYQQRGGEDNSAEQDIALLRRNGDEVKELIWHNDEIKGYSAFQKLRLLLVPTWSSSAYARTKRAILDFQPDVVHVQNFFPLVSPSAYYAAQRFHIPVVQTLRNYRLFCPGALFLRNDKICERCAGRLLPWPAVVHRCYHHSVGATASVAMMLASHNMIRTWQNRVDAYIALTEFAREKVIQCGLPAHKVVVRPNFLEHDLPLKREPGSFALFVGRLSTEKGIRTLLAAWQELEPEYPLVIIGDGPLENEIKLFAEQKPNVSWLGRQPTEEVTRLMHSARCLVFPSIWYEGLPRVIVEAYAAGLPIIASDLGSMASLIQEGQTGRHFRPGNSHDLAHHVRAYWHDLDGIRLMQTQAREEFEEHYTDQVCYKRLIEIYQFARGH